MKKNIAAIFVTILLIICLAIPAVAMDSIDEDSIVMSLDEATCVNYALNYAESYYFEIYGSTDTDGIFDSLIPIENSLVADYLQKRNYYENTSKRFGTSYKNYENDITLIEVKTENDVIYCSFVCRHSFIYEGRKTPSSMKRPLYFTFAKTENDIWALRDFYDCSSLDLNIRGQYSFYQYINTEPTINEALLSEIEAKQNIYNQEMEKQKNKNISVASISDSSINLYTAPCLLASVQSTGTFNRLDMVYYAVENAELEYPVSGNSLYCNYVPFETLGTTANPQYDCTNFISHALLSGGAIPYKATDKFECWYFYSSSDRSYTWSHVGNFYDFVKDNEDLGPFVTEVNYDQSINAAYDLGDIIQIDYTETTYWDHSTIITGFDVGGTYIPLITSRSNQYLSNVDIKLTEAYSGSNYRVLVLDGFRY